MVVVMSFFWGGENQQHVFGGAREDDGKEHAIHIYLLYLLILVSHSCEGAGKLQDLSRRDKECTCMYDSRMYDMFTTKTDHCLRTTQETQKCVGQNSPPIHVWFQ
jgi:hypothetical protein